jgi:histidinol-phosphate aminotransferase
MGSFQFNEKLKDIEPYVFDKTKYPIRLDANESFFTFPKALKEEFVDKLSSLELNRYPDGDADEVCELYSEYCGVPRENIMAGNGSDELIQILVNAFLEKNDKILTLKPDFSMYGFYTSVIGGKVIGFDYNEDMTLDYKKLILIANSEKVKLIIFSNPNNPAGSIIPPDIIRTIVESCNAMVIVDEAYYEFYGDSSLNLIKDHDNVAILRTCSKAMGLAAARLGFLISNKNVIYNVRKVKPPFNVNALTQAAGTVILKYRDLIQGNIQSILEGREFLIKGLGEILGDGYSILPTYSNYVYIKCNNSREIYDKLLQKGISIRYFADAIRITVGNKKENEALLFELRNIIEE